MMHAKNKGPILSVIIDTEEEFDWDGPFSRAARSVTSIAAQDRAQGIFQRYGIVPTYVIDDPVARDETAVRQLKGYQDRGEALIGTHLHPWVSPPDEEEICRKNSYPGNLAADLEFRKLKTLTDTIETNFGIRPTVYKAGRYGIGPNTGKHLAKLGYLVDASIVPYTDFSADHGPDFSRETPHLRAFQNQDNILALPLSNAFAGLLRPYGPWLYPLIQKPVLRSMHVPGICARLGILERIRLSPEGQRASDHIRLVRAMYRDGFRVFSYTYHSPSLAPGYTPYVRNEQDLKQFLDDIDRFFDFFFNNLNGKALTPLQIHAHWLADRDKLEQKIETIF